MSAFDHSNEIASATTKATPAVAGATYALADMPASEIAAWLTALYVALQIFLLLPKLRERVVGYWNAIFNRK